MSFTPVVMAVPEHLASCADSTAARNGRKTVLESQALEKVLVGHRDVDWRGEKYPEAEDQTLWL